MTKRNDTNPGARQGLNDFEDWDGAFGAGLNLGPATQPAIGVLAGGTVATLTAQIIKALTKPTDGEAAYGDTLKAKVRPWSEAIGVAVGMAVGGALMATRKYKTAGTVALVAAPAIGLPRIIDDFLKARAAAKDLTGAAAVVARAGAVGYITTRDAYGYRGVHGVFPRSANAGAAAAGMAARGDTGPVRILSTVGHAAPALGQGTRPPVRVMQGSAIGAAPVGGLGR